MLAFRPMRKNFVSILWNPLRMLFSTRSDEKKAGMPRFPDKAGPFTPRPELISLHSDLQKYDYIEELGRGGFGRVIKVVDLESGMPYSLKHVKPNDYYALSPKMRMSLEHRYICTLLKAWSTVRETQEGGSDVERVLLFEFCPGPELRELMDCAKDFIRENAPLYIAQLYLAIEHLAKHGIAHRDIKPENLLMDFDGRLKLADFGLAAQWGKASPQHMICGTIQYMAPEMVLRQKNGQAVDWWSFGIVSYEMICGQLPFKSKKAANIMFDIAYKDFPKFAKNDTIFSEDAQDFLKLLLVKDPGQRMKNLGFKTTEFGHEFQPILRDHPFFKNIDWKNLMRSRGYEIPPPDFIQEMGGWGLPNKSGKRKSSKPDKLQRSFAHRTVNRFSFDFYENEIPDK